MLAKHKYLLTYHYSEIIHDLTVSFIQNIVEGVGFSRTSKKGEIRLLGVAESSLEELIKDYEDFLRQRNFRIWLKDDPRISEFRKIGFRLSHLSNLGDLIEKPKLPDGPEEAANFLLTLCHQATYLLYKQINKAEETFIRSGGYSENLFKKRLESRIHQ